MEQLVCKPPFSIYSCNVYSLHCVSNVINGLDNVTILDKTQTTASSGGKGKPNQNQAISIMEGHRSLFPIQVHMSTKYKKIMDKHLLHARTRSLNPCGLSRSKSKPFQRERQESSTATGNAATASAGSH